MRTLLIAILLLSSAGSVLVSGPAALEGRPHLQRGRLEVQVCFEGGKTLRPDELRSLAEQTLATGGIIVREVSHWSINVSLKSNDVPCIVLLQNFSERMWYGVSIDKTANATLQFAGPMRHGSLRPGVPVPHVEDGKLVYPTNK